MVKKQALQIYSCVEVAFVKFKHTDAGSGPAARIAVEHKGNSTAETHAAGAATSGGRDGVHRARDSCRGCVAQTKLIVATTMYALLTGRLLR